jgi:hypothetical protein
LVVVEAAGDEGACQRRLARGLDRKEALFAGE